MSSAEQKWLVERSALAHVLAKKLTGARAL